MEVLHQCKAKVYWNWSFTHPCTYLDLTTSQPLQQICNREDSLWNEAFVFLIQSGSEYNLINYSLGYTDETKRLYGVLELRLKDREYLSGPGKGTFSIADIKAFPWWGGLVLFIKFGADSRYFRVRGFAFSIPEMTSLDEFPNLKAWVERVNSRPAVQAGLAAYA